MRKLIALVAVTGLMVLALAAATMPLGQGDAQDQAFPGERSIEVQGEDATSGGNLHEPAITTAADSITEELLDGKRVMTPTVTGRNVQQPRFPGIPR